MTDKDLRVSEAQIALHWQEENKFPPAPSFTAQANMTHPEIYQRFSQENFPDMYVSLKPKKNPSTKIQAAVVQSIEQSIGKIAFPTNVWIVPDMPKTRSGKIMRRVLAPIYSNQDVGDVTTLARPDIVGQIRQLVQGDHTESG